VSDYSQKSCELFIEPTYYTLLTETTPQYSRESKH
jgi:hypothetical protein